MRTNPPRPWWYRPLRGDALDAETLDAVWALVSRHAVKDRARFEATLRTCDQVYVVRDGERVVGLVCFATFDEAIEGVPVAALYGHWFVLDVEARARNIPSIAALRAIVEVRRRFPGRPIYGVAKCSTTSSYRMTIRAVPRAYPSRQHAFPPEVAALRDRVMRRVAGEAWIADRGVYRGGGVFEYREGGVARGDPDPDVAFYAALNPDQQRGDGLVVVVPCDAANLAGLVGRMARRLPRVIRRGNRAG